MKKSIIAILIAALIIPMFHVKVYANVQIPVKDVSVDEVYYVLGQNIVTGEPVVKPTMSISWDDPDSWGSTEPIHTPDYYDIKVRNMTLGSTNTITIDSGSEEFTNKQFDLHDEIKLDTGSFYEISVEPNHYHTVEVDGEVNYSLAPVSGYAKKAYAVTDLNVELIPDDESITVIWDDVGLDNFEYRIVYAVGDYSASSKEDLVNNKEGEIQNLTITHEEVEQFYDETTKRKKLMYTIDHNVYPGQIYSVMVESLTETYEGKNIIRNRNYPNIFTCSTNINLEVYEDGEYVRLEWDIPASFKVGQGQEEYELVEANLMEYTNDQGKNIVVFDDKAANMEYYKIPRPINEVEYQLQLRYEAVDDSNKIPIVPSSKKVPFVPFELRIQPTKPIVPSAISEKIIDDLIQTYDNDEDVRDELEEEYLVSGDTYDNGAIEELLNYNKTFHINDSAKYINIVWDAFKRREFYQESPNYGELITDSNVYYDIWVTNDLEALAAAPKAVDNQRYSENTPEQIITNNDNEIIGYKHKLEYYYDPNYSELQPIVPNQIYYIKILAKKRWGTDEEIVSKPTIVSIYYGYNGDVFEPPSVAKPPLKVKEEEITQTEVSIVWKESWHEIIATNTEEIPELSSWAHELWVSDEGEIYTEPTQDTQYFPIYESQQKITEFVDYVNNSREQEEDKIDEDVDLKHREVDLGADPYGVSDVKYKFYKIPYERVQEQIDLEKKKDATYSFVDYYDTLVSEDKNGTDEIPWEDIEPVLDIDDDSLLYYQQDGLLPNTTYLFLLYPYRELFTGELVLSHYPTPLIVATEPEGTEVYPDPTVPNLYVSDYTSTEMTLAWKYNTDFEYEIRYSEYEDIEDAVVVDWELPDPLDPLYPTDGAIYDQVKVKNLFPNTEYYFWIRAKQPITNKSSMWSNVTIETTKDIDNPLPPKGVGIASSGSMKKHNLDKSVDKDFIAIEWLLDANDVESENESKIKTSYSYIMEISDNPAFVDPQYVEVVGGSDDIAPNNVEILEKNLVKISELISNKNYYIRMKTRVTVTGDKQGQLIVKDSLSYSKVIRVSTLSTGEEYDGNTDPALEILPAKDYEIIYDSEEKELTFRFRSDVYDSDNVADNNVHQRLITNLIKHNKYTYNIDVENYKNKPITTRSILIPYTIIEAFDEYKLGLTINTGDLSLEIPYNALATEINKQVYQYGAVPTVKIQIKQFNGYHIQDLMPENALAAVSIPQQLDIYVNSDKKAKKLQYTDKDISINLKTTSRYALYGKENITYIQESPYNNWKEQEGTYDAYTGNISFDTGTLGTYGVYITDYDNKDLVKNSTHWSEKYRKEISRAFNIEGIDKDYNPQDTITSQQMLNIMYGIITSSRTIDIDGYISKDKVRQLEASKVKVAQTLNQEKISREEAISMFVRAYEIKNSKAIQYNMNQNILNNTNINTLYKENITKANEIGLISDLNNIRPKDKLTFGEMFTLWSKIN